MLPQLKLLTCWLGKSRGTINDVPPLHDTRTSKILYFDSFTSNICIMQPNPNNANNLIKCNEEDYRFVQYNVHCAYILYSLVYCSVFS